MGNTAWCVREGWDTGRTALALTLTCVWGGAGAGPGAATVTAVWLGPELPCALCPRPKPEPEPPNWVSSSGRIRMQGGASGQGSMPGIGEWGQVAKNTGGQGARTRGLDAGGDVISVREAACCPAAPHPYHCFPYSSHREGKFKMTLQ